MVVGRTPRLDDALAGIKKLADGRLCSPGPMQYAVTSALTGDRSHQFVFNKALEERATLTADRMNAIPGMSCVMPRGAFYAMPSVQLPPGRTDEDYILGLLREKGVLCVYGSGFGTNPADGFFRIVFLAPLDELSGIYDSIASFTADYYRAAGFTPDAVKA
jgi:aspartate/methionine/tyrosine aminotransferase